MIQGAVMTGSERYASRGAVRTLGLLLLFQSLHAATPTDFRQKVGVYVWGKLAGGLDAAVADLKKLGDDRVARVSIVPAADWDPSGAADNSALDVKLRRPDYHAFVAAFPVVMLTAYDAASSSRYKTERLDAQHLAATKDEFRRFTLELAKTPGRKIVSNWEFENDCQVKQWAACAEYYQARLDGILEGRKQAKAAGLPGEIFTAFEFTVVPGFTGRSSGLVEVGSKLKGVDYYSYSAWWSIAWDADAAKVYKDFEYLAKLLRNFEAEKKLTARLIVGEFGEYWNLHPDAARMKSLIDASLDNGIAYLFSWVLYDQPGNKDEWGRDASHFGKFSLDRSLTPQGKAFQAWFTAAKSAAGGR
jgi:hypothetical protein